MDWTGLLRESWRITRRSSALWGLGAISALQAGAYGLIVVGLIVPMTMLTQLLVELPTLQESGALAGVVDLQTILPQAAMWIQRWEPLLLGGIFAILGVWLVLGVFDVAATAGAISQTMSIAEHRSASVRAGLRDGFAIWWRTIGLLAIAALPSLLYLLVVAAFTLFTISIPLAAGAPPDLAAMRAGNGINSLLSLVVGLLGIPLAVLVQLGLRFAVVEHLEWKPALRSAYDLARANLTEVVQMYLVQVGVTLALSIAFSFVFTVTIVVLGVMIVGLVAGAGSFSGGAMFVTLLGVLLVSTLALAFSAGIFVWLSVVWTLFWRRLTGRDPRSIVSPPQPPVAAAYPHTDREAVS